jgi:hypothetical protein
MALVKFGGGVVQMSGSIGGTTYGRNRYGNIARARTTPVNANTARQSAIRAIMSSVSQSWFSILTASQRAAWGVYASNVAATNKLGEVIYLSGYNQFIKSNVAAQNAGLAAISDAPTIFTLPGEDTSFAVEISVASQELSVTVDDTDDWLDEVGGAIIVQMGMPQNDSIEFFGGPYRHADSIDGDATTPPTIPAIIACPFPVAADQKVWTRGRIIRADGRLSDWFRVNSIVGA